MSHKRRLISRRNNHQVIIMDRPRNKFWFVFFVLFFFWYLLLYGFDWSSLPGLSSVSNHQLDQQQNPIQSSNSISVDPQSNDQLIVPVQDINNSTDQVPDLSYSKPDDESSKDATLDDQTNMQLDQKNVNVSSNENATLDDQTDVQDQENAAVSSNENDEIGDLAAIDKEIEPLLPKEEAQEQEQKQDNAVKRGKERKPCTGRYIYMHDLPTRFNDDYIKQCKLLNKWHDMCQYLVNGGLGESLGNPQRLFQRTGWYVTHQFTLDVIFHSRMKNYDCLTNDSSKAGAIYVPYYPGLDVSRFLWDDYNASVKDADILALYNLLRSRPEWNVMGGMDHFMVSGRITWDLRRAVDEGYEWGNKLMVMPESQNMTMVTIESSPWHRNDFAIPYPTYFHPSSDEQIYEWQRRMRRQRRRSLFCFAGAPRPNMEGSIRGEIMAQCAASGRKCKMMECKDDKHNCLKPANVMKMFQSSVFCLQPSGDSFTRRSTFDSIVAGCIPVFFTPGSAYVQYLWHLPKDFGSYSVLIPEGDVKSKKVSIESVLSQIPASKVAKMRETVIGLIPSVIYADPRSRLEKLDDAFDLAIKGVVERVDSLRREIKEERNSSGEFDQEYSWKYFTLGTTEAHEWDNYFKRYR